MMEGAGWSLLPPLLAPHPHPCLPFTPTQRSLVPESVQSWAECGSSYFLEYLGSALASVISVSPLWEETLRELLPTPGACEAQHREHRQTHGSSFQGTVAWQLSLASAGFKRLSHPSVC